ncbi:hypothetical protein HZR84_00435 [Hyphobacterium sp. CCMP332]|nr:hypothetical protein HZR84_00435 [Hyphobacterium sp. CCMP332]
MVNKLLLAISMVALSFTFSYSQDDLMDLLESETDVETTEYTYATFKTTRIINGQSIENPAHGVLQFVIGHRFGKLSDGAYDLFGLDNATVRLGFEYGINERLAIGIGRSSVGKTVDGMLKFKLLRQSSGLKNMPFTLVYYGNMAVNGLKYLDEERENYFSSRYFFNHQLLIARKISNSYSVQLTPGLVHRNLVATTEDPNDIYSIGFGQRIKLSRMVTLNTEYFYQINQNRSDKYDAIALGVDIETGGHIFSLHITNSRSMIAAYSIPDTDGNILDGDIYFGFNVNRVFTIVNK